MATRGKHFKAVSPKKVSRRKRTPRCDSCGRRDGEPLIEGDLDGPKVRLKLCARCRGVAYCGMDCQKASWKQHREICVQHNSAADLPAPSPLVNHLTHRRRKFVGPPSATPTPRTRENAPTKHPFFGRQDSVDSQSRSFGVAPAAGPSFGAPPRAQIVSVWKNRDQEQKKRQQDHDLQREDRSCPSPPTMQRLSMPGGGTWGRRDSRGNMGGVRTRRASTTSSITPPRREHQGVERGVVAATAVRRTGSPARENCGTNVSPNRRRLSYSPAPPRSRRSTSAPQQQHNVLGAASASPPYFPPRREASAAAMPSRRESAPLFPVALEDKRLRVNLASVSAVDTIKRGPPPPYSYALQRAELIRKLAPPVSSSRTSGKSNGSTTTNLEAVITTVAENGTPSVEAALAPSVPPPSVRLSASFPPPSSAEPSLPPSVARNTSYSAVEMAVSSQDSVPVQVAGASIVARSGQPSPVRQEQEQAIGEEAEPPEVLGSDKDARRGTLGDRGQEQGEEDDALGVPAIEREEEDAGKDEAAEIYQPEATGGGIEVENDQQMIVSKDTHGDSREEEALEVADASGAGGSEASAAEGLQTVGEDSANPTRLSMDAPPPILPTSSASNDLSVGLRRATNRGVFDSCPSSAGVAGFAGEKQPTKSPPLRSMSVGTVPNVSALPLAVAVKEMVAAVTATAWNRDRRSSPRPRPPVSPGPAILAHSSPTKSPSAFRKKMAAAVVSKTAESSTASSSGGAPGRKAAWLSPRARSASTSVGSTPTPPGANKTRISSSSPKLSRFVPAIELSPQTKPPTPHSPGPRPTDTALFYQRRSGSLGGFSLPAPSRAYLGRPNGFSIHVLVASALTAADLSATAVAGSVPPAQATARRERTQLAGSAGRGSDSNRRIYYSFDDRGRVARALQPGDVVLLTPGRYEARAWGLQDLVSSVEIIGAGDASACVVFNDPPSSGWSGSKGEHYLVGVMGGSAIGTSGGEAAPAVIGRDEVEDDSDSGWEDGALGVPTSAKGSFNHRAVRVRLANLTLEQGSGYRGAVYQLGRDSHLELDGCEVRCAQGGVNIDQGTCLICDTKISGSEVFGVHIGGEGAVEHCFISDCGRGGGGGKGLLGGGAEGGDDSSDYDDGTDVNRVAGMPAISVLQSSRVRVRFNVVQENAGHSLQCRDAPLPGGDEKHAILARRAEAEAEERLRRWLGRAAVLLREHLQEQHREGSIVTEGNRCRGNKGCKAAKCVDSCVGTGDGGGNGVTRSASVGVIDSWVGVRTQDAGNEVREPVFAIRDHGLRGGQSLGDACEGDVGGTGGGGGGGSGSGGGGGGSVSEGQSVIWNGAGRMCIPTAENEGLPLPAAMTLRFLAAMDEGYVGSMREENARTRRRKTGEMLGPTQDLRKCRPSVLIE